MFLTLLVLTYKSAAIHSSIHAVINIFCKHFFFSFSFSNFFCREFQKNSYLQLMVKSVSSQLNCRIFCSSISRKGRSFFLVQISSQVIKKLIFAFMWLDMLKKIMKLKKKHFCHSYIEFYTWSTMS